MADVKMSENVPCQFDKGGWESCKKPSDNGWCSKHEHITCVSCGEHAIKSCDTGMGGLACGSPLCATCSHDLDEGKHVTREFHDAKVAKREAEKQAIRDSRTNPERRMHPELQVPANLFELLKGNWEADGYTITHVYYLELSHNLMGFFPAVFQTDDRRIITTLDLGLLEKIWRLLEPRRAIIRKVLAYVNTASGIYYIYAESGEPEECEKMGPENLLVQTEFDSLTSTTEEPFVWARGLIGGTTPTPQEFYSAFIRQAQKIDHSFESSF